MGCGSGQLSLLLAEHFEQVTASDVSADQIANAAPHDKIRYNIGSAEEIAVPDKSADLITAAQAAHWFDLTAFYAEARRIAKPGAVIALITYGVLSADGPAADCINRFYWEDIHPYWPDGRAHVEDGYRSFEFPFTPISMPQLSIKRSWTAGDFIAYCRTWSAVKRAEKSGAGHLLEQFEGELSNRLGTTTKMNIIWPISIRAGSV